MATTLNGAMRLSGKYYATLGNTEKVIMLQTTSHNRHKWKDMKYKNKRDSYCHKKAGKNRRKLKECCLLQLQQKGQYKT